MHSRCAGASFLRVACRRRNRWDRRPNTPNWKRPKDCHWPRRCSLLLRRPHRQPPHRRLPKDSWAPRPPPPGRGAAICVGGRTAAGGPALVPLRCRWLSPRLTVPPVAVPPILIQDFHRWPPFRGAEQGTLRSQLHQHLFQIFKEKNVIIDILSIPRYSLSIVFNVGNVLRYR